MYNVDEDLNRTQTRARSFLTQSRDFKDYVHPQFLTLLADLKNAFYGEYERLEGSRLLLKLTL